MEQTECVDLKMRLFCDTRDEAPRGKPRGIFDSPPRSSKIPLEFSGNGGGLTRESNGGQA